MTALPQEASTHTPRLSAGTRMMNALRVVIARIPPAIGNPLADRIGDLVYRSARKSRRNVIDNMRHVLGPGASRETLKRAVHGVFRNLMRNYYDLCRAPDMRDEEIDRLVDFDSEGWQRVVDLQQQKRPVILVSAHFGSFDIMTQVIARKGLPLTVLIVRFRPAWLSDFITDLRAKRGLNLLLVDEDEGSGLNVGALKRIVGLLRSGGMIGVLADRNMEPQGVRIPFFGKETLVAAGVAKMALRTRSVVIPGLCYRLAGNRYSLRFDEPIETRYLGTDDAAVKTVLTQVFRCYEEHIRRNPEQWVLLQPVWR